eukprot:XP_008761549.1 PREDICTED: killer cell lectin-like receptor family I member 2 isoform X1 [Rattus norvegicus]
MPRKKQNERGTNKQEIINIETKSSTFQEKQRQSKTDQISTVWRKEQKKQELKVHTELHPQHRTGFNEDKGTDPWLTTWRIITVILGTSCIILVTKVGFLIPNYSFCDLCSHDWIAFGNNFYLFFRGTKTWAESKSACEELNSYLLDIDSRAELENLLLFEINGWILFKTDAINRSLRKNYIKIHQTLFNDSEKKNHSCHYLSGNQFSAGDCSSKKAYTCEFNLQ